MRKMTSYACTHTDCAAEPCLRARADRFIKQEAMEKAREIKVKADEEFAIEKVRPYVEPCCQAGLIKFAGTGKDCATGDAQH